MAHTAQGLVSRKTTGSGSWENRVHGQDTTIVHAGVQPDAESGAILTPIVKSTTFVQDSIEDYMNKGYSYSRTRNPTVNTLEHKIASLEGGQYGSCFGTGMAACTTIFASLMGPGDHAVVTDCSYGGTNRACREYFARMGMEFTFVDMTNLAETEAAIKPNTKIIFSESPANPALTLVDVEAVSILAKSKGLIHVCDNTMATPCMYKPLDCGADVLLISTTKYYDGHNQTVGGAVICNSKEINDKIRLHMNIFGNIMTPDVAFIQLQTSKTMKLRIEKQSANAMAIASFLETHPKVDSVVYPGLESFPQRELALRQHKGGLHGGMIRFEVKGGTEAGRKLMNLIPRPWSLCENLGPVESIVTCPAVMTHANMLKADREKVGITDGLVRLSVGIEDGNDLIQALKGALDQL